jgi:hypothetical protein
MLAYAVVSKEMRKAVELFIHREDASGSSRRPR